jgi:outer membrane protein TolC
VTHHPKLDQGKALQDAARANLTEQRSGFFPSVGVRASTGDADQNDDTTRANTGGSAQSWINEGDATFTQPIFSGFSTVNHVKAARARLEASALDTGSDAEDIALTAAKAHLNIMRTGDLLAMARSYYDEIKTLRDNIQKMVKEGAGNEADLMQAEEILMAANTTRLGFEEAAKQAQVDYLQVVGAPPQDGLQFGDYVWDKYIPANVDSAVTAALANNPRLLAEDKLLAAYGAEARAEKGNLSPRVDAELSYLKKHQSEDMGGELKSAQALLKMSWNLSLGGAEIARIHKASAQEAEARARHAETLRDVEHAVRQKFISIGIVDEQYGLYTKRREVNQQIVDNYKLQFEGGKQTNLQIIGALAHLFESESSQTDAYYRCLLSRFELLNAMGSLQKVFVEPQTTTVASQ